MKYLFILVMLMPLSLFAQNGNDTIQCYIPVVDNTSWWKIYRKDGKVIKTVTKVNLWDIPSGGYVSEEEFVNPDKVYIKGYYVLQTKNYGTDSISSVIIQFLDTKKKPLDKKWLVTEWNVPLNGFNRDLLTLQIK